MLREEAREALSWIRDPKATAALEAALAKSTDKREKLRLDRRTRRLRNPPPRSRYWRLSSAMPIPSCPACVAHRRPLHASAAHPPSPALAAASWPPPSSRSWKWRCWSPGSGDARTVSQVYQSTTSDPVRLAAFIALMKHAPDSAKPAVMEAALKSKDDAVRHAALAEGLEISLPSLSILARPVPAGKCPGRPSDRAREHPPPQACGSRGKNRARIASAPAMRKSASSPSPRSGKFGPSPRSTRCSKPSAPASPGSTRPPPTRLAAWTTRKGRRPCSPCSKAAPARTRSSPSRR